MQALTPSAAGSGSGSCWSSSPDSSMKTGRVWIERGMAAFSICFPAALRASAIPGFRATMAALTCPEQSCGCSVKRDLLHPMRPLSEGVVRPTCTACSLRPAALVGRSSTHWSAPDMPGTRGSMSCAQPIHARLRQRICLGVALAVGIERGEVLRSRAAAADTELV